MDPLESALRAIGHEAFRPGQREAIETLLEERRLLLVAPTGGGKSLTYQLPATILEGLTLVVSPLVALMHDQVQALEAAGIPATYLASTLEAEESRRRLARMHAGELRLVYVAPERAVHPSFFERLSELRVDLLAVDEAHCISEWGHDFRPEYGRLSELVQALPDARVLACTATATPVVRDEIMAKLGLGHDTPQMVRGFARPNLALAARESGGGRAQAVEVDRALAEALGAPGEGKGAAIIYAGTRKRVEKEAQRLESQGWAVAPYHAGLSARHRERCSRDFSIGRLEVVVATNAFGMGIDRADVRLVVHSSPPGSIEAYYQEVGRAGRDGEAAQGLLLTSSQDLPRRRRLIERSAEETGASPELVEHRWGMFLELMRWAEGGSCRHDAILRYFGDEAELLGGCGRCDVCQGLAAGEEEEGEDEASRTLLVRKALSGVARVHGRFGLHAAVSLLRGEEHEGLARVGLDQVKTFGVLSDEARPWLLTLVRRLVSAGWVSFSTHEHPRVLLTEQGRAVMQGQAAARLLLPPRNTGSGSTRGSARRKGRSGRPRAEIEELDLEPEAQLRFEALRAARMEAARSAGVPPYVVASDRSLRELALLQPRTLAELTMAHGIGDERARRWGEGFLAALEAL